LREDGAPAPREYVQESGMPHVVLLGDSVFDNKVYVGSEPSVSEHLAAIEPEWEVTLLAVDGDTISGVRDQLIGLPSGVSHLVVSAGGNDILPHQDLLLDTSRSGPELLLRLSRVVDEFARSRREGA
jgi:hypothetical protein